MKVYCVRIGDKYGPEYEDYINKKLSKYEVIWIREPINSQVELQWNKMFPMGSGETDPICVIDIDIVLVHDYEKIFDYPIQRGEFLVAPNWWNDNIENFNGGFFKYHPIDCQYIYDEFMSNVHHWQQYFIQNGTTTGPVNGEQFFVKMMAEKELKIIPLPDAWFTRWTTIQYHGTNIIEDPYIASLDYEDRLCTMYEEITGNELFDGNLFHQDIKFIHFTHSLNKPHEWDLIEEYYGTPRDN